MSDLGKRKNAEFADVMFASAANTAYPGFTSKNGLDPKEIADILHKIAAGLEGVSVGLRATYMLLAEVKQMLVKKR
jgi:hypothetical protein